MEGPARKQSPVEAQEPNDEEILRSLKALDDLIERSLTVSEQSLREQINI